MKDFINAASIVTSGNLVAGFLALVLAAQGELGWAAALVGVAAACDSVDGIVARRQRCESVFGSRLDSLADLLSFGAAPALILYSAPLDGVAVAGTAACLAFVLSGAWRLARFSLLENRDHFVGFPIPPAAVIVVTLAVTGTPAAVVWLATAVLSALMVSTLPVPTLGGLVRGLLRRGSADLQTVPAPDVPPQSPQPSPEAPAVRPEQRRWPARPPRSRRAHGLRRRVAARKARS
jgi:CDP-diacylglycerol--serine O-phosphatidyltransferase